MNTTISRGFRYALALVPVLAFAAGGGLGWWSVAPAMATDASAPVADAITVYKTPTCGCCSAWVDHLRAEGFAVTAHDVTQSRLDTLRQEAGLPRELASCHTGFADGYLVEGHVPARDIRRLLQQRPDAIGVSVPGMPVGSPGMEVGDRRDPYDVLLFDRGGALEVFASHNR